MAIALTLQQYLADSNLDYEILEHSPTRDSMQTAEAAHIPGRYLAKAVLLEDEGGRHLLAVLPSTQHVDLGKLHRQFNIHLGLATEDKISQVFRDCEPGAVPPVGNAYGLDVMLDTGLDECPDVYFEGGDHVHLVHLSGEAFKKLIPQARQVSMATSP